MMGRQRLTRKMANGYPDDVRVAAKSGTIGGLVSNDVGAVQFPDGRCYAVAVLTVALVPGHAGREMDAAIGTVARPAVEHLQAGDAG
jgi:beta-lactamase class A